MNHDNLPGSPDREKDSGQHAEPGKVVRFEEPQSVQSQASAWLARLDGSEPSEEDLQAFKQWVNEDRAHIAAFEKVTAAWDELNVLARLPLELQQRAMQQQQKKQLRHWQLIRGFSYAAMVVVVAMAILLYRPPAVESPVIESHWTAVGEQKTITLSDDSIVQLNTNSRLKVDYSARTRAIYLHQGEAHFDVKEDPQRPFEVYAGTGRVRAVGTAFSVRLDEQEINIIVTEGIVEIAPEISTLSVADPTTGFAGKQNRPQSPRVPTDTMRVEAGSTAVFDQAEVKLVQLMEEADIQRRLAWQEGLLIFSGESLEEVVAQVSRYTDTKILIKSEQARSLRIGGQFKVGDTRAIFSALEKGFGLKADYVTNSLVYLSYQD